MTKSAVKHRKNHLKLTPHARTRLSERELWPALGAIARIAHSEQIPRFREISNTGRAVERIEADGLVIVIARDPRERLTLVTVHSGAECGAKACARIALFSRNLRGGGSK